MGLLAAPNAFATLARPEAAAYVARLFLIDARITLGLGLLLLMMEQRLQRGAHEGRVAFSANLLLPLAAMFFAILGYDGLQPLMAQAKQGAGLASFAMLHGLSLGCFAAKAVVVMALAWRTISSLSSAAVASRA